MTGPASASSGTPTASPIVPVIIGSALFMQTLDATIIANALPTMAVSLREDPLRLNLAISAYLLSTAVSLPLSGWIADRYGARRVFMAAIALFAFSSWLCALSQTLTQLIGARVLQGVAGATLTPVGRLVLLKTVPRSDLVRAMAVLTMPALIGPIVGPVVGGFIVTYSSWQWIFYINIPIAALGIALVRRFVPDIREEVQHTLDLKGFVMIGVALATLMYSLENAGRETLAPLTHALLLMLSFAAFALYRWHARRTPQPIIDLTLFRHPSFNASVFGGAFARLIIGAGPFLLALLFQLGFGLSAFQAGLLTFTSAAGALLMKTAAPPILRQFGFRRVLMVNTVLTAVVIMAHALIRPDMPQIAIIGLLFTGGFLRSLQFTSLGTLAFADVPQSLMSRASSVLSMSAQLAQALGVAFAAMLLHVIVTVEQVPEPQAAHTAFVFFLIGLTSLVSLLFFRRLPANVAADLAKGRAL
jgi:EmrB/QacA subfamily drug resistance transporter